MPAGLTGNPVPAFCIKLPSSYHVKDARLTPEKDRFAYDTGTVTDNLMISYDSTSIAQQTTDVTGEMKFRRGQAREERRHARRQTSGSRDRTRTTSASSRY